MHPEEDPDTVSIIGASKWRRFVLQGLVSIVGLGLVFYYLRDHDLGTLFLSLDRSTLLLVLGFHIIQHFVVTLRWQKLLPHTENVPSFIQLLQIQFASAFAGLFLPASIGSGLAKIVLIRPYIKVNEAVKSVAMDRYFTMFSVVLFAACSSIYAVFLLPPNNLLMTAIQTTAIFFFICIGVLFLIMIANRQINSTHQSSMAHLVSLSGTQIFSVASISLASTAISILSFSLLTAYHLEQANLQDIPQVFYLIPIVIFLSSLPISFSGWGIREGATLGIFTVFGLSEEIALIISIHFGLISAAPTLIGALLLPKLRVKNAKSSEFRP